MANVGIQSPWVTTYNKIKALFERDDDLTISPLSEDEGGVYTFSISSANETKINAIEKILANNYEFGNVTLNIKFIVDDAGKEGITAADLKNAFTGNNVVSKIETIPNPFGSTQTFVMFNKEVIQFYNDDISDRYGNYNGLAEDIARELFNETDASISYCTDIVPSNQ